MARKNLLIGAALAAALLAGCSGTPNDGNASAENTTPSSTSSSASGTASVTTATSTATSVSESEAASTSADDATESTTADDTAADETAADETAADDTGSVQPAALDDQSKVWFGTFCTGLTGAFSGMMGAMGGAMGGAGSTDGATDPKATQAALVSGYQQVASAFSDTASTLSGLPAPKVAGGDKIATDLPGALNALGEGFATATEKFAAAEVTDEASLTAAMDAFTAETEQYGQQLETEFSGLETTLTPEIGAAVQALPECAMMTS